MANIFNSTARPSTVRNKPRSPLPPQPATPRPFLPPSHYAAAGGFSTSLLNRPGEQSIIDAVGPKIHRRDHGPRKNAAPISRTPHISDSESSFDINSVEEFPFLKTNSHTRREASRAGIPDLETQLLPSLRDTIDRMTRPPSTSFNSVPGYLDDGEGEYRKQRKRISPEPMTTPTQHNIHTNLLSKHHYSPIANELTTPKLSRRYSNQSTPNVGNHPSRTKTPVKSALKSSLRSPTPKLFTPDTPVATSSMASPQFKSVKNLLSRKNSGTGGSSGADKVSRKWGLKDLKSKDKDNPQQFSQSNTRTNPHSHKKESQNAPTAGASSSRMPADSRSFQSNIPRPRAKLRADGSHRGNNMDDSDVEGRYETGSRGKRKLTIADAEALVADSSSESEGNPNQDLNPDVRVHRGRSPTNYRSGSAVGLGLSFPHSSKEINLAERRPVTNLREDTFIFHSEVQEKTLRFSLPASESAESAYSDNPTYHRESFRKSYGTGDLDIDHARRRAAFMDIISDLGDLEVLPSQRIQSRYDPSDLASKHFRNSPASMKKEGNVNHDPGMEWPERESRSVRRHHERRRSSSCAPKTLASPEEDDEHVPIVPPRSRSACQRHASPTSRPSPKSLRELIKSRNSFSKSPTLPKIAPSPPTKLSYRPTFYKQGSPVERSSEDEGYSDGTDDFQSQAHHRRASAHHAHTEASSIAQRYRSAAARERSAFGIPPSESDEFQYKAEHQPQLPHVDSDLSFLSESVWQDNCDELSIGAESLFRQLSSASTTGVSHKSHQTCGITPRLSVISPTLSDASIYEDQPPEVTRHKHGVVNKRGENSMRRPDPDIPTKDVPDISQKVFRTREAVIQEIFETEENLLRLLHICMRQFILPLRMESSRSWITGVPRNVARLLDWFDDIVNLHEQIYQSLCSARDSQSPTTDRVSESLRCFVYKAEVYQPYLIRLPDVCEEILFLMTSCESDFGQFVNLQERASECEGWTFEGLLMLPVHRLSAYQTLFSQMLDLTSKTHQDYLSTFSLSRSTNLVIKVMTEVKVREDEYNLIKRFSTRIQGLSASSQLATRDRRLLHSGPLSLVISDRGPTSRAKRNSGSGSKSAGESKRSGKLADNITDWAHDVEKSGSAKPRKSSSSVKYSTALVGPPPNPAAKSSWFSRLPLRKRSRSKSSLSGKEAVSARDVQFVADVSLQCMPVHVFVFNDLVLLAQTKSPPSDDDPLWVLIRDVGVIKLLSIAQITAQNPGDNIVLSLEVISLDGNQLDENTEFRSSPFQVVDLMIPRILSGESEDSRLDSSDAVALEPWLLALRQCSQSTLRKLVFPGHQDTCSDQLVDTHLAISSLIGSGLPMPRSPSGHLPQIGGAEEGRFLGDEREERGWWSLRYQQVFREFQRQDSFLSDVVEEAS